MKNTSEELSQLRKNLKHSWIHKIRVSIQSFRLGEIHSNVYLDRNVELMRFPKNIYIKSNVIIKEGARICSCNEKAVIQIGENTTVGYHSFIFASSNILIGDNCLIAPFVYIVDSNHRIGRNQLINLQGNESEEIVIGNDVWISSNVTILKGVQIADGAIIGANSVVNKNVGPYEIWAGTPARKIGERE